MGPLKNLEKFLRYAGVLIILAILTTCFFKSNGFFSNKKSALIRSDGFGYYSYLPAIFIYNDYTQEFLNKKVPKYYEGSGIPDYMENVNGNKVDKYFFGTAVMMYPFFITAHWLTIYFNKSADGYSLFYQYFIGLAAVFYVFVGIYFCNRLLRLFGATIYQSLLICLLLVFGTNIYYYSIIEPSMSHVYSFAAISSFLFYCTRVLQQKEKTAIVPAFISLGLIILIRPINLLVLLFLPFLAGSLKNLWDSFLFLIRNYILTIAGGAIAFFIVSLQFLIWYKQAGEFIVYSYTYERFYFNHPNFFNVLISYRKGLFIYTPLCFLSIFGLITLYRKNKFSSLAFLSAFILLIYVVGCWHQWYYGSSFGFRPLVEYYALFAVLLFYSLNLFKAKLAKTTFILLCFLTIPLNQIQAFQYNHFILHWDRMSYYKYWKIFLKTDYKWYGYVWDNPEPADFEGTVMYYYKDDLEKDRKVWHDGIIETAGDKAYSGVHVSVVNEKNPYSRTLILTGEQKLKNYERLAVVAAGYIQPDVLSTRDSVFFVVSHEHADGQVYFYKRCLFDSFYRSRKSGWKRFELAMKLGRVESESDITKVYIFNPHNKTYKIDDLEVKIMDLKP